MAQGAYYTTGIGAAFGKIVSGTKTVTTAGTAEQVTTTSTPIPGVWVSADLGNTEGPIVLGDVNVVAANSSMQGISLIPGNMSIFINVNNLDLLWVDAQGNGDKLVFAYVQPETD